MANSCRKHIWLPGPEGTCAICKECGKTVYRHKWKDKPGSCVRVCERCGAERGQHTWIEEVEDGHPVAYYVFCEVCKERRPNTSGPNRPWGETTRHIMDDIHERLRRRQDICSWYIDNQGNKVWFPFPEGLPGVIAEMLGRSEEQVRHLLGMWIDGT